VVFLLVRDDRLGALGHLVELVLGDRDQDSQREATRGGLGVVRIVREHQPVRSVGAEVAIEQQLEVGGAPRDAVQFRGPHPGGLAGAQSRQDLLDAWPLQVLGRSPLVRDDVDQTVAGGGRRRHQASSLDIERVAVLGLLVRGDADVTDPIRHLRPRGCLRTRKGASTGDPS
jgi:hypothetical protein